MSDLVIFLFGLVAFLFAVGPLAYAAYLDLKADNTVGLREEKRQM